MHLHFCLKLVVCKDLLNLSPDILEKLPPFDAILFRLPHEFLDSNGKDPHGVFLFLVVEPLFKLDALHSATGGRAL